MKYRKRQAKEKVQNQKEIEMGGSGDWPQQQGEFYPNGLLVEEVASVTRPLDPRRCAKAEASTAELISLIQPNRPSEMHRNAVANYVQRLVSQCVPCQVFTFGSVPLKTYLPDGDIDLTAFSEDKTSKDNWAMEVRDMLVREEKNEHAEFPVKEVQYIQAEVKIIKCLVDNIVVDISFNQLGGLCTLCFLEEVDNLINQNHLFKRSVILIKAWCYYESRLLGAHHGLISTYALETLVLYIFHVFNNSFAGPLEVLYRFLEFFSKFDWANFCVSLWGPVPIGLLPSMTADPPRKDGGELLLNKLFLNACSTVYSVFPVGQENLEQPFISKHFNVIDPLRLNNNLGRSVSKGNFYRIRSAFNLGAQQLARIFECQEGDIETELKQFFINTWDRHGKGSRPDAPILDASHISQADLDCNGDVGKHTVTDESTVNFSGHDTEVDELQHSLDNSMNSSSIFSLHQTAKNTDAHRDLRARKQKDYDDSRSQMASGRQHHNTERNKLWKKQHDDIKRTCRLNILQTRGHASHHFARTSSSPELTSMSTDTASNSRPNVETETSDRDANVRLEYSGRMRNGEIMENHVANRFIDEPCVREGLSRHSHASESVHAFSGISVSGSTKSVIVSTDESSQMHLGEQDFMYKVLPSGIQNYGKPAQMPVNIASHPGVQFPPSVMGYSHQNYAGTKPTNFPVHEPDRATMMHYSNGPPYPAPFHPQFKPVRGIPEVEVVGRLNEGALVHLSEDSAVWNDGDAVPSRDTDSECEDFSTASCRLSPSSPAASSRTKACSESSWDGKPSKSVNPERYPVGKKTSSTVNSGSSVNSRWEDDWDSVDHMCDDINDDRKDWASLSSGEAVAPPSLPSSLLGVNQLHVFGQGHISCQNAMSSFGPILLHPGSQQSVAHNHAVLPVAFYSPGPVPIVTMVPIYNLPAESGTSDAPANQDNVKKSAYFTSQSGHSLASANEERLSHSGSDVSRSRITSREHSRERGSDIFNSDFASHWNNLQYGRLCQSSQLRHPLMFPPSVALPPPPLQGQVPFDAPPPRSPGRSIAFARAVPVPAPQSGSGNSAEVSRRYGGEVSRQRNGTGTYFPNPKIMKERQYSTSRQYRSDFGRERNEDFGNREENGNFNSKPHFNGRFHPRNHYDKPNTKMERSATNGSHTDGSWRQNSNHLYHFSKNKYPPRSAQYGAEDVDFRVYQMHPGHGDDISSYGHALPPFVMLYPYPQAVPYGSWTEKLQFGSVRPEHFVRPEGQEVGGLPKGGDSELHNYQGATGTSSPNYVSPPDFPCDGGN